MRLQALQSIDLLRTFEAAARHLSFTKAAEELFVTPSAVSRQIRTLEENLGVPLYLREVRGLRLTDAGLRLRQAVEGAWHQLEATVLTLKETRPSRVLSIGTTVSFAALWLVPRLPAFRLRHPGIDIRVSASSDVQDTRRGCCSTKASLRSAAPACARTVDEGWRRPPIWRGMCCCIWTTLAATWPGTDGATGWSPWVWAISCLPAPCGSATTTN
jgi:DNA-binding transcriptional LysR family regulator